MYTELGILSESQTMVLAVVVLLVVASVVSIASCVGWALGRRVPPVLPVGAFALAVLVPVVFTPFHVGDGGQGFAVGAPELRYSLVAKALLAELGGRLFTPLLAAVPLLLFCVVAGVIGGIRGPRRMAWTGAVTLCGLAVALLSAVSALGLGRDAISWVNPLVYVVATLGVAFAVSRAPDKEAATVRPLAASAAALAFTLLVFLGEAHTTHWDYANVLGASFMAPADQKASLMTDGLLVAEFGGWARGLAMLLAGAVGLMGVAAQRPTSRMGALGTALGLVVIPVGVLFVHSGAPSLFYFMLELYR